LLENVTAMQALKGYRTQSAPDATSIGVARVETKFSAVLKFSLRFLATLMLVGIYYELRSDPPANTVTFYSYSQFFDSRH